MADAYSLNGKRMRVLHSADGAVVGSGTHLLFTETDSVITARYEGGRILIGFLAGRRRGATAFFRYAQVSIAGEVDGGVSRCDLELTPDGRLRLNEHFRWESRPGQGTNVFEEILEGEG